MGPRRPRDSAFSFWNDLPSLATSIEALRVDERLCVTAERGKVFEWW